MDEDIFNEESKEDQEIMKSIEFAEKQLNHKMISTKQESSAIQPGKLAVEALNTKIDSSLINLPIWSIKSKFHEFFSLIFYNIINKN